MKAHVIITLKNGVLDPQGQAIESSLHQLGFAEASGLRMGKFIELEVNAPSKEAAKSQVEKMCEALLANTVIESYRVDVA